VIFVLEGLFWLSIFAVFYAYFGYLILLWLISLIKTGRTRDNLKEKPSPASQMVTLLISAYNEEANIEKKLSNSLDLNYPKNLLEIIVVSDGSTDRTNEIVAGYADKGVNLCHYEGRIGKTACLNKSIPLAKGDIIVFSDANSLYNRDAILSMVRHFEDDRIGFVTGYTEYVLEDCESNLASVGLYAKIEILAKKLESRISSCVGADGAIFAIRKNLYQPLMSYDINDFVIPLNIIRQGYRGVFEEDAYCLEKTARDQRGEFSRQIRITSRTLRALFKYTDLLNPFKYPMFSFELISHKFVKFMVPFLLFIIFVLNSVILSRQGGIYLITFSAQILFYFLGCLGNLQDNIKFLSKINAHCKTFILVNFAIFLGWLRYIQGETYTTWQPDR
jgi:cellulose synthase/poly-beta-1,6-N-acetylglucosamine synthase-like glycosyltransferase